MSANPSVVLVSWGARNLWACRESIARMPSWVRVLEVRGHTEHELATALPHLLDGIPDHLPVMIAPDDLVVPVQAVECLTERYVFDPGVWCGWSNVDLTHGTTNIMHAAPSKPIPESEKDYDLLPLLEVAPKRDPFTVGFNGFSLLTMPAAMYRAPETRLHPCGPAPGYASDWALCYRLAQQSIPITCDPCAFAPHFKIDYTRADTHDNWKRLDLTTKTAEWVA